MSVFPGFISGQSFTYYPFKLTRFVHTNRLFQLFNAILVKCLQTRGYNRMKVQDNVDLLSLFLFVVFFTHQLACFWCFLGFLDRNMPPYLRNSWVYHKGFDFNPNDSLQIYVFAVYWILQTLTTVGYGDYYGNTRDEYLYSMVVEVSLRFHRA